mmetsp:Transcript_52109/g.82717  ORF Transcript_52109/g.82717 Transcript_52109/m.82717 type:complete len:246 (-) Transcript_52109:9-746(-)
MLQSDHFWRSLNRAMSGSSASPPDANAVGWACAFGAASLLTGPRSAVVMSPNNLAVSRPISAKTFSTSLSTSPSSSSSAKASSIISSTISALAISFCIACIVCAISGTFIRRFISRMTPADIFREVAVDIVAIEFVRCKLTEFKETFVRSRRLAEFRERTTCFVSVITLSFWPFLAMASISFLSFPSSCLILLMSRSKRLHSLRICLCHSLAFSFTCSSFDFPPPIMEEGTIQLVCTNVTNSGKS